MNWHSHHTTASNYHLLTKTLTSLWLAAFYLTKSLVCNIATYLGIPFILESSFQKCALAQSCVRMPIIVYCSSLHPSGRLSNTSERPSEFEKNPAFKCIRPDDVAIPSGRQSMFNKEKDFLRRHRYGKTIATARTSGLHRPNAILDKARHGEELQPSGRQSLLWKLHAAKVQPFGR